MSDRGLTEADRVLASMGLPRHPPPHQVNTILRQTAAITERDLGDAIRRASILAARGYSASTLGDGGPRGTDNTSSTERHGLVLFPDTKKKNPPPPPEAQWHDIDHRLATTLAALTHHARTLIQLVADINHHASDIDPIPAGQGECMACGRTCRPRNNPEDRLRSGLCPTDYKAWQRAGSPHHGDWIRQRTRSLTDDQGRIHPPQHGDSP